MNTRSLATFECGTAERKRERERALKDQNLPVWKTSAFHRYEKYCSLLKLCYWGSVPWCWAVFMCRVTYFSPWWPQEASYQQKLQCNACGLSFAYNAMQGHFVSQAGWNLDLYERFLAFLTNSSAVCCRGCFWMGIIDLTFTVKVHGKNFDQFEQGMRSTGGELNNACSGFGS